MSGDEQKCPAAGMDDYLPQPSMSTRLEAALVRWCPAAETEPVQGTPAGSTGVLDAAILRDLRELQDQSAPGLLAELCDTYVEDTATRVAILREAEARADWETVHRTAHALKGGSAAIGATSIARLCVRLETQAREMDRAGIRASLDTLDALFDLTRLHLRAELDPSEGV
jgi:HPt (histidine-containing phosphotransfer) domain-containing protein